MIRVWFSSQAPCLCSFEFEGRSLLQNFVVQLTPVICFSVSAQVFKHAELFRILWLSPWGRIKAKVPGMKNKLTKHSENIYLLQLEPFFFHIDHSNNCLYNLYHAVINFTIRGVLKPRTVLNLEGASQVSSCAEGETCNRGFFTCPKLKFAIHRYFIVSELATLHAHACWFCLQDCEKSWAWPTVTPVTPVTPVIIIQSLTSESLWLLRAEKKRNTEKFRMNCRRCRAHADVDVFFKS